MSTEFVDNLSSPLLFSPVLQGNALPIVNIKTKPISWNYMQAPIISGPAFIQPIDIFNRYYLDKVNPNPLSGIL